LDISGITPRLPYAVEGMLRIGSGLPPGEYGLILQLGEKIIFRRDSMIRIVRPNVGATGFVQGILMAEPYHRPGDTIHMYVQGSGFIPENIQDMRAQAIGYEMGNGSFTYINGAQMRLSFDSPAATPPGSYGVQILNAQGASLFEKKDAFKIVPPNWIAGVQVSPPVKAGGQSTLRIIGRDLSDDFMKSLKIEIDEPGITLAPLAQSDANLLTAQITVAESVAPGDYWLQLRSGNQKISPPFGSIIKVEKP
jgi:hypothetical protein